MYDYDLIIVGGGPGGYVAGAYASQFGKKAVIVEKGFLGGCCLNVGCIPTKTILEAAARYTHATQSGDYGIHSKTTFEWNQLREYIESVRADLRKGIYELLKSRKCDILKGVAYFIDEYTIAVGEKRITAEKIIIATGSAPSIPQKFSRLKRVVTSDSFWDIEKQPKSMVIVGGGVIGCEIASALSRLGTKVTIVEQLPSILSVFDKEAVKLLEDELKSAGVDIWCGDNITDIKEIEDKLFVSFGAKTENCECLLWATGRTPVVPNLGNVKLRLNESGFIVVDSNYQTSSKNIYSIGDVNGKGMLAHIAISQAMLVIHHICTGVSISSNSCVPLTVFTYPSIARLGRTEAECTNVAVGKVPFAAIGYSHVVKSERGYFKIIRDIETDTVVGAEIVGYNAFELIHVLAPIINKKVELGMFSDTMFAHPTLSEGIKLAIEASYIRSPQV